MTKPNVTFDASGLVPCIVQDDQSNDVLMLGYMNAEALEKTMQDGRVTFYSRSRKKLWTKGETSGNFLEMKSISSDCDQDTLLIRALPTGPVCHTGSETCFGTKKQDVLETLERTIANRKNNPDPGSYTSGLFSKGMNSIAQKVGEEAVELVIESKDSNQEKFLNEAADLLFHYLVLLQAKNCTLKDVKKVLESRVK